ncbi:hypothetical protein C8D88_11666 [Lentzea atacamensis]|uniref:Uncharacterized protein n=1 Tax=Lentzea atacamensis TaxID=531938 RepID=A0A316HLS4_9PSEU|nr:hypothetical protein [Lentzea atacamensis]PWK81655.1 hypothetical protein C8D88_11666 [Lentzea atacamensis]
MVLQEITDHVSTEVDPDWAHPDEYTADDNWRTGFEYGGAR